MTLAPIYADAEGAAAAWANGVAALTGQGNPVSAGFHLNDVRSPSQGAVGYIQVVGRAGDDVADLPRVSFLVLAKSRGVAETAARATANALERLTQTRPTVTTARGDVVRVQGADAVTGPAYTGDVGGEHEYRVDATLVLQPA